VVEAKYRELVPALEAATAAAAAAAREAVAADAVSARLAQDLATRDTWLHSLNRQVLPK
jgi:hypothetical protein